MQNNGMPGSTSSAVNAGHDAAERATAKLSQLSDTAQQTVERLTQTASQAATRLGERTQEFWEAQGPAVEKARVYMREHPMASIGIAVAVGLVLARLLTRR